MSHKKEEEILKRIRRGDYVSFHEVQPLFQTMQWADIQDAYDDAKIHRNRLLKTRRNVYEQLKKKFADHERMERNREMMERENDAARMTRMVERENINRAHLGKFVAKLREVKEKTRRAHKNMSINAITKKAFDQTKQNLGLVKEEEKVKARRLPKHLRNAAKANASKTATTASKTQKKRK
jgi:hypothetical protein